MLGVGPHLGCEHPGCKVRVCKLPAFSIKLERLDVRLVHGGKSSTDLLGCRDELLHRQGGQDEDACTADEAVHEPDRVLGALFVLAATQH